MMNDSLDKKLDCYYKEISSRVTCSAKQKRSFIRELKCEVEEFIRNSPEAGIDDIKSVFGTPSEIAESFTVNITAEEEKKIFTVRKIVLYSAAAFLLVWILFAVISLIDVHTEAHGYFSEGVLYIYNVCRSGIL